MNKEEIEYHHFNLRLCCYQYEDWDKLLYAEEQEAEELDSETPGTGTAFSQKLKSFRTQYQIGNGDTPKPTAKIEPPENPDRQYLSELIQKAESLTAIEIGNLMDNERTGKRRLTVIILFKELYKNLAQPGKQCLTPELIERKAFVSAERTRKNFVRRVCHKNKLFALEEIRSRYPAYEETLLWGDLKQKTNRPRKTKKKPVLDLRRSQLIKLARLLERSTNEAEYHTTCCRMVMLQNAHDQRLPIPLTVKLQGETLIYSFNWKTREEVVKSFVELANSQEMTHERLKVRYQELLRLPMSY